MQLTTISRIGAATLISTVGIAKLLSPGEFGRYLEESVGFGGRASSWVAIAIALVEIALAIGLLLPGRAGSLSCALVATASLISGTFAVVVRGRSSCGCFGALGAATVARRLILSGAMLVLVVRGIFASPETSAPRLPADDASGGGRHA